MLSEAMLTDIALKIGDQILAASSEVVDTALGTQIILPGNIKISSLRAAEKDKRELLKTSTSPFG